VGVGIDYRDFRYKNENDVFVTRLSPSGGSLWYSTFLGGAAHDMVFALAVDRTGAATVAGGTGSPDFPTTAGALQAQATAIGGGPMLLAQAARSFELWTGRRFPRRQIEQELCR